MKTAFSEITVNTKARREIIDISAPVEEKIENSGVSSGICVVSSLHTTAAIVINENENGVKEDILKKISEEFPQGAGWHHDRINDNGDAHLASVFLGSSKTLLIKERKLVKGAWQRILFIELDGPRTRRIVVEAIGEQT